MTTGSVDDPAQFIEKLGGLHDVEVNRLDFDVLAGTLELRVDDLHANFDSLPEDPGRYPCILAFSGITRLAIDVEISEGLRISSASVSSQGNAFTIEIGLNLGGGRGAWDRAVLASFDRLSLHEDSQVTVP